MDVTLVFVLRKAVLPTTAIRCSYRDVLVAFKRYAVFMRGQNAPLVRSHSLRNLWRLAIRWLVTRTPC
jgi:ABC-type enterochelin transport system ATPase subunit